MCVHETDTLLRTGDLARTIMLGDQALARVRALGGGAWAETAILAANVAEAQLELGRVEAAGKVLDPMTRSEPSRDTWAVHQVRARLDLVRGLVEDAWDRLGAVRSIIPPNLAQRLDLEGDTVEVAVWRGRPEETLSTVTQILAEIADAPASRDAGPLLESTMRAYADLAERARARHDGKALRDILNAGEHLVAQRQGLRHDPFADYPGVATAAARHATWRAEQARLNGTDQADLGRSPQARGTFCSVRIAARTHSGDTRTHCSRSVAHPMRRSFSVAQPRLPSRWRPCRRRSPRWPGGRASSSPPSASSPRPSDDLPYAMTPRELDVLRLLGTGATNAEIGRRLYMSPKTASVHVSAIIRKMGVSGRVQAATVAERMGLLPAEGSGDPRQ